MSITVSIEKRLSERGDIMTITLRPILEVGAAKGASNIPMANISVLVANVVIFKTLDESASEAIYIHIHTHTHTHTKV